MNEVAFVNQPSSSESGNDALESVACSVCGAEDYVLFCIGRDRLYGLGGEFRLVKCSRCGTVFLNPRPTPESLGSYYLDESYVPYMHAIEDEQSRFLRLNRQYGLRKRCHAVAEMEPHGGKILDVGCATGVFLDGMRRAGEWEVFGVEPNASAAGYACRRFGIEVHNGMLKEAGYPDEYFDVVSLWHVIEHLPDPVTDLREVHRILKPDGLLVLTTPNLKSFDARLFGRFWACLETPRHLFVFSHTTLSNLVQGMGFTPVRKRCLNGTWWAFATSLQFLAEDRLHRAPSQGKLWEGFRAVLPLRLLLLPYFLAADRLGRGSNVTLFFVKRP